MKLTAIYAVVAISATTQAAAIANPAPTADPEAWCLWRGQSCWKAKRVAEAFTEAITTSGGFKETRAAEYSNSPGRAAYNAKRGVDELAALVASTQQDPDAWYNNLGLFSQFPPDFPANETDSALNKRHEDVEIEARWCLWRGQSCWKRSVAAKRDEPSAQEDKRWCLWRGQSCWKAKRAAEAIINTIDSFEPETRSVESFQPLARTALSNSKRSADPEAWCLWRGQSCWKREADNSVEARCNAPGGACTSARKDLHAMYAAARSVIESIDNAE